MKHLIIISLILALAVPAFADYHYASHEGSDEYPYTSWETAALFIQDAVDAASPHDTVYIGAGDYHQRVDVNTDSLGLIGIVWIVYLFGTNVIAAYSIAMRIDSLASMAAMNFAAALASFVGENLGANKPE